MLGVIVGAVLMTATAYSHRSVSGPKWESLYADIMFHLASAMQAGFVLFKGKSPIARSISTFDAMLIQNRWRRIIFACSSASPVNDWPNCLDELCQWHNGTRIRLPVYDLAFVGHPQQNSIHPCISVLEFEPGHRKTWKDLSLPIRFAPEKLGMTR